MVPEEQNEVVQTDADARKSRTEKLHRRIEKLVSPPDVAEPDVAEKDATSPSGVSESPNEFIQRKMKEMNPKMKSKEEEQKG